MSLPETEIVNESSSLNISNILADFFLKKIDMPSYSDDSDHKRKTKKKKSKHKKGKHKKSKSKHRHRSTSSSSSQRSESIQKNVIDDVSSSEEMSIKRLRKIKNMKLKNTVLSNSPVTELQHVKKDNSGSSEKPADEKPVFYGPSLELLRTGTDLNSSNPKSEDTSEVTFPDNNISSESKYSGRTVDNSSQSNIEFKANKKGTEIMLSPGKMLSDSFGKSVNNQEIIKNDNGNAVDSIINKNDLCSNISSVIAAKKPQNEIEIANVILNKEICERIHDEVNTEKVKCIDKIEMSNFSKSHSRSNSKSKSLEACSLKPDATLDTLESRTKSPSSNSDHSIHKKKRHSRSHSNEKHPKKRRSHSRCSSVPKHKHKSRSRSKSSSRDSRHSRKKKKYSDKIRSYPRGRSRSHSRSRYSKCKRYSHSRSPHRRHSLANSRSRSHSQIRYKQHLNSKKRSRSRQREFSSSRSRNKDKSNRKKIHSKSRSRSKSKSRRSRSRSRSRRSQSKGKSKRSRSKSKSRSRSKSKSRRSRSKSKSRITSKSKESCHSESKSPERKSKKIDQAKILETARKNVLKMMKSGTLPEGLPVENLKKEQLISIQAGGKSVQELTDFCQRLSQKENECIDSNEEDEDKADDETGFIHHPFKIKEPGMIKMNIKGAVPIPIKSPAEKVAETARLSSQFPVSSGNQHKQKELEWIPVVPEKKKPECEPTEVSECVKDNTVTSVITSAPALPPPTSPQMTVSYPPPPPTPASENTIVDVISPPPLLPPHLLSSPLSVPMQPPSPAVSYATQLEMQPPVMLNYQHMISSPVPSVSSPCTSIFKPPKKIDISSIVAKRFQALTKLQQDPNNPEALSTLQEAQESIQEWVQSQQVPGLFTGSTDAKMLSVAELCGPKYYKFRKDYLTHAPPVTEGKGMSLLKKMGWNPGEGLGKNKEGSLEPLMLDIKTDKKGLVSEGENSKKGASSFTKELQGKHPVSALMELCSKRKWKPPLYTCILDKGPPHRKQFCFKVEVNGVEYQPLNPCSNKKVAKADAAVICLQALNVFPKNP